jgi:hypothetical protein
MIHAHENTRIMRAIITDGRVPRVFRTAQHPRAVSTCGPRADRDDRFARRYSRGDGICAC